MSGGQDLYIRRRWTSGDAASPFDDSVRLVGFGFDGASRREVLERIEGATRFDGRGAVIDLADPGGAGSGCLGSAERLTFGVQDLLIG